jgi:low affinity Fe/Cu permease
VRELFAKAARAVAGALGTPYAFALALTAVVVWAILGPFLDFSDSWQLVINTSTTIITFLVVFLIQSTQNRDSRAVHLKLDELLHVMSKARNKLIDCEELSDQELSELEAEFRRIHDMSPDERERTVGARKSALGAAAQKSDRLTH